MKIPLAKINLFLILTIFLMSGCGENKNDNGNANETAANAQSAKIKNETANISKDDVDELGRTVTLPVLPDEATWREENTQQSDDNNNAPVSKGKKLTAVLKFSAADAQRLVEQIDKGKPAAAADVDAESWFPPELIAKSQESGDESLKGTSYAANDFLQEPYKNGKITRINDTDFFVLELTSY